MAVRSALSASETRTTRWDGTAVRLLVAGAVFWAAYDHGSYSLAQQSTLGVLVWWSLLVALVAGVAVARPPLPASISLIALWVLALLALASVRWSHDADGAFAAFAEVLVYLGLLAVAIVLGARFGVEAPSDGIAFGISAIAVLALASRFFPSVASGRVTPFFSSFSSDRLSFPVDYWNGLAILVALAVPLLLRRASEPGHPAVRGSSVAVLPVVVAVVYLASSRGGVAVALAGSIVFLVATARRWRALVSLGIGVFFGAVGLVALRHWGKLVNGPLDTSVAHTQGHHAAVVYVLVCAGAAATQVAAVRLEPSQPRSHQTLGRLLAGGCVVVGAVALVAVHPVALAERFTHRPRAIDTSNGFVAGHLFAVNGSGRWQMWTAAVDEWLAHPLAGGGAGTYYRWWLQHGSLTLQVRNAHSLYLETMGELGLLGLLALLMALVAPVVAGVRRLKGPPQERTLVAGLLGAAAGFLVGLGVDWIWQLVAVGGVGILILGLLASPEPEAVRAVKATSRRVIVLAGASGAAALVLLLALVTELRLDDSQAAAARSNLSSALSAARSARALEPWSTAPLLQLALVYEKAGRLAKARSEISAALAIDKRNWQLWLVDSRLELESGRLAASRRSLRHAAYLNPQSGLFAGVRPLPPP
jgi:O-antigen ligase